MQKTVIEKLRRGSMQRIHVQKKLRSPEQVRLPEGRSLEVDMSRPIQGTLQIIYRPLDQVKWKDRISKDEGQSPEVPK
jgi:hypothetical protein